VTENFAYKKVAKEITALINSGVFPSGSRLPAHHELAEILGASRASIRESMIALDAQGLIELKGRSGAYVLDGENTSTLGLPTVTPLELTEARAMLESEAAALAAPIISEETLEELENYIAIMSGAEQSDMSPDDADAAFHRAIANATENEMIIFLTEGMWKIRTENAELERVYRNVCDLDSSHREHQHSQILKALKDRNPIAARRAMRAHFTNIIDALLKAAEEEAYQKIRLEASENRSRFLLAKKIA
jgi:DNA-binding FadR family transcriptional regulator